MRNIMSSNQNVDFRLSDSTNDNEHLNLETSEDQTGTLKFVSPPPITNVFVSSIEP